MPDKYQTTVNTFDAAAEKYLNYFKDFTLYQPTYDWFLSSLSPTQINVLEVACGPGQVSHYLLKHQPALQIRGIDLAPKMVELAQMLNPQAQFSVMDCRDITKLARTFDAIMCAFCLPYLSFKDSQHLLYDMINMLSPEGVLYLSTSKGKIEDSGYQGSKSSAGGVYVHYHDSEQIKSQLISLGMSVIKHKCIEHTHNDQNITDEFILAKKTI